MYDHGAGPHIDGIAIHPYDWDSDPDHAIHWRGILDARATMVANGDGHKPLWINEWGWNGDHAVTATKVDQVLHELKKPGWHFLEMANYLVLNDGSGVEEYGLVDEDLHPRPGYYAFQGVSRTFPDVTYSTVLNPSFEEWGPIASWHVTVTPGRGPDLPQADNGSYGATTPYGNRYAGKITRWGRIGFNLGQIIEVTNYHRAATQIGFSVSGSVNMHSRTGERGYPSNVHQVWEMGWNSDGNAPDAIDSCDDYRAMVAIDGSYTGNDAAGFHAVSTSGSLPSLSPCPEYVVLRLRLYNDYGREWSYNNVDAISFSARALGGGFMRGDSNADGAMIDIGDAGYLLQYLFSSGTRPPCMDAADTNDDGAVDISDAIYVLLHLFADGPAMPDPHLACGIDPTEDAGGIDLGCESFEPCP
jgi:hypothetical protein